MRTTTIERRRHADSCVNKGSHYALEIARRDFYVAVIDHNVREPRLGNHLREIADFSIQPEHLGAKNETYRYIGKFDFQLLDGFNRGIIHAADAEKNFVFTRVLLVAVAGEACIHVVIETLERLQNADWRMKCACVRSLATHEIARAPKRSEVETQPAQSEDGRNAFNDKCEHERSVYRAKGSDLRAQ
jgi:hypothetical protein